MVRVAAGALGLVTVAPDQAENVWPGGAAVAVIFTTVPAAYVPLPPPLTTVRVYVGRVAVPTGTVIALLTTEPGFRTVNVADAAGPCQPLAVMLVGVTAVVDS